MNDAIPDGTRPIDHLRAIMARLRDPARGCPWDVRQTFATIAPYTVEEAYEVADAIARGDADDLKEELGDLLLQVIFHAQMAAEEGLFDFDDVATAICDKLVRRHPHVFGDADPRDEDAVRRAWEEIKAAERAEKAARRAAAGLPERPSSVVDEVPVALPALTRAQKLQKRVARVGFDWPAGAEGETGILSKIKEEAEELQAELVAADVSSSPAVVEEFGDLLFSLVNFARRHGIDPEVALANCNEKFARRFRKMEELSETEGFSLRGQPVPLERLEALWEAAKAEERGEG